MNVELLINNSASARARYIGWAPSICSVRLTNTVGAVGPVTVVLSQKAPGAGGRFVFRRTAATPNSTTLTLVLPLNGTPVRFFILGQFGRPSLADRDAVVQVRQGATVLLEVPLMVRIRKNGEAMTPAEVSRFVGAFAAFNNNGMGRFADFRRMHVAQGSNEAHFAPGFLSWHRAFMLDLERELQAIDPSVSLPYWKFDRPAPRIFSPGFMGAPNNIGTVQFAPTNPLQFWRTDGAPGVNRSIVGVNPATTAPSLRTEAQTLALGNSFSAFSDLEGDPHGFAHTNFGGFIGDIPTAVKDPLFFMLHANVDRLWAKWQRRNNRFNPAQAASFSAPPGTRIGHRLNDTMWPWNGITTPPRPNTAPGGTLATSPAAAAPGLMPTVGRMIDYQGSVSAAARCGFDYDDVPFA